MSTFNKVSPLKKELMDLYPEKIEKLNLYETSQGTIEINVLKIFSRFRNQGVASNILQRIVDYADSKNKIVHLTPTDEFGSDKKKLEEFYQRFGFVKNSGKNKDFTIKDSMLRYPQTMNEARGFTLSELRKDAINLLKSLGIPMTEKNIRDAVEKIKEMIFSTQAGVVFEENNLNHSSKILSFEEFMNEGLKFPTRENDVLNYLTEKLSGISASNWDDKINEFKSSWTDQDRENAINTGACETWNFDISQVLKKNRIQCQAYLGEPIDENLPQHYITICENKIIDFVFEQFWGYGLGNNLNDENKAVFTEKEYADIKSAYKWKKI